MPQPDDAILDFIVEAAYRKIHQATFTLMPGNWRQYQALVNLDWKIVPFTESSISQIPVDSGGVYTFVVEPMVAAHPKCSYLVYVGETHKFSERYERYLRDKNDPKARPLVKLMLNLWDGYLLYCYARIDDPSLIHTVQDNLIRALDPVINRMYPKDVQGTVTGASL